MGIGLWVSVQLSETEVKEAEFVSLLARENRSNQDILGPDVQVDVATRMDMLKKCYLRGCSELVAMVTKWCE
jgi:hypothetical protein